jgi:hypothetical protein
MKKLKYILVSFILCIIAHSSYAQNLVPNYSFEVHDTCPTSGGEIYYAPPWKDPTNATSDYFNSCSAPGNYGVPLNTVGSQNALDGSAYAGFTAYAAPPFPINLREYIQVKLIDTLISGNCYKLIFYVSVADNVLYGVNKLSAYFSDTAVSSCHACFLTNTAQINYSLATVIGNSTGWYKVEGVFLATGGEQYMTIGNFNTDSNTTATIVNPTQTNHIAYYYIDSVSLVQVVCTTGINEISKTKSSFTILPNPNNGSMVLNYSILSNDKAEMKIYDITGKLIGSYQINNASNQMEIRDDQLNNGIYFYRISINNQVVQADKIVIIK